MSSKVVGARLALVGLALISMTGAAPPPTTSVGVEQRIEQIRTAWARPDAPPQPHAEGWGSYFDAINEELVKYRSADSRLSRSKALGRLYRLWEGLGPSPWGPAQDIRYELEQWLRPRIALNWAEKNFAAGVESLPEGSALRSGWATFQTQLFEVLTTYEASSGVGEQSNALRRLTGALHSLRGGLAKKPWAPAYELEDALAGLVDRPNMDATFDLGTISPLLDTDPVKPEVIYFKGQTTYVTPGPRTGFGLLTNDAGISFFNSQYSYSQTPIQGFAQQIAASDPRGARLTRIYTPSATTYNTTHVMAQVTITPEGAYIVPNNQISANPAIDITPVPGKHLQRSFASLLGFSQDRILSDLREKAVPELQEKTIEGSNELTAIKTAESQAKFNAELRRYLVGGRTLDLGPVSVSQLWLSSRPSHVRVNGLVDWKADTVRYGSPFPKPRTLRTTTGGVGLDVHLSSLLNNIAAGYLRTPRAQEVQNVLIRFGPHGEGKASTITTTVNVDYPTYLTAVKSAREEGSGATALRLFKPEKPPEFAADAQGRLVVILRDLTLEVPAPPQAARGGLLGPAAEVYRLKIPTAEIEIDFELLPDQATGGAYLTGKIGEFAFDAASQVEALGEDETKGQPLNLLSRSTVLGGLAGQIANRPINAPVGGNRINGLSFQSASPLDPTGWIRLVLVPNGQPISVVTTPPASDEASVSGVIGD